MKALDQGIRLGIRGGIEQTMGLAVAPRKARRSSTSPSSAPPTTIGGLGFQKPDATQDQGTHDPLAEIGLGDEQRRQPVGFNKQRLSRLGCRERRPKPGGRLAAPVRHEITRPWLVIVCRRPDASRCVTLTFPERTVQQPGRPDRPTGALPDGKSSRLAERLTRSISIGSSVGNI